MCLLESAGAASPSNPSLGTITVGVGVLITRCVSWRSQNQRVCSCVKHLICADRWDVHSYIWTMMSQWVSPVETLHFNEPALKLALQRSYNRLTRQHLLSLMGNIMTKTCQRWSRTQVNHLLFESHILYSISLDLRLFTLHSITQVTTWRRVLSHINLKHYWQTNHIAQILENVLSAFLYSDLMWHQEIKMFKCDSEIPLSLCFFLSFFLTYWKWTQSFFKKTIKSNEFFLACFSPLKEKRPLSNPLKTPSDHSSLFPCVYDSLQHFFNLILVTVCPLK